MDPTVAEKSNRQVDGSDVADPVELTILMPCLNEAETLQICIEKALKSIDECEVSGEVLIADNGSNDGSVQIAKNCGARVVHVWERGYGNALRAGIEHARGRWIIMGDADDSYDFSSIRRFVEELRAGNDLVMGCRLPVGGGEIRPGAMPWHHRWIGNPVLTRIGKLFFAAPVDDFHCGLRGFSRDAIRKLGLSTPGMEFASEMVIKSTLQDLKIVQVPIVLHPDGRSRPPHLRSFRDGWRHLRFMLLFSPRWLFLYPGLVMLVVGLLVSAWLIRGPQEVGGIVLDIHTLAYMLTLVLGGFQVLCLGVFVKCVAVELRLMKQNTTISKVAGLVSLESGILASAIPVLIGIVGTIWAFGKWSSAEFGAMDPSRTMRVVLPSIFALLFGGQLFFNSFLFGTLRILRVAEYPPASSLTQPAPNRDDATNRGSSQPTE